MTLTLNLSTSHLTADTEIGTEAFSFSGTLSLLNKTASESDDLTAVNSFHARLL